VDIRFFNEEVIYRFRYKKDVIVIASIIQQNYHIVFGNICVIFSSDDVILNVNRKFLNHNYSTDIITFGYENDGAMDADLFICIEQVRRNAKAYHVSVKMELMRVIIHGLLHLCGFDDQKECDYVTMKELEDECLYDLYGKVR
jgi:rRNA maturation RNase YbeY